MDKISGMSAFVRVAETKSFTRAGEQLGLTASAVSKATSRMEARLGVQLFRRNSRSLSLTAAGENFLDRSRRILEEISAAEQAMSHLNGAPRGVLRVDLPLAFGRLHVASALPEFLDARRELSMQLRLTDRFVDLIEEGVDVAVRMSRNPLNDSRLVVRTLTHSQLVICGSPAYLALRGEPKAPDDLKAHDCLSFVHRGRAYPWRLLVAGQSSDHEVTGPLQIDNGEALRDAALAGVGLSQLHSYIAAPEIAAGRLCPVMTSFIPPEIPICILYVHGQRVAPNVRTFVDFMVERFARPGPWTIDFPDRHQ